MEAADQRSVPNLWHDPSDCMSSVALQTLQIHWTTLGSRVGVIVVVAGNISAAVRQQEFGSEKAFQRASEVIQILLQCLVLSAGSRVERDAGEIPGRFDPVDEIGMYLRIHLG